MAAEALGGIGPTNEAVIPRLAAMYTDPDDEVANSAGMALARIGEPALPTIHTLVHDDKPLARKWAIQVLSLMVTFEPESQERADRRRTAFRSAMRSVLTDPDERLRSAFAAALKSLGTSPIPDLVSALDDPSPAIRIGAARMLGALGDGAVDALAPLRRRRGDPDPEMRKAVAAAIRCIDQSEHFDVVVIPPDP
jgi:HEAT repeat protein